MAEGQTVLSISQLKTAADLANKRRELEDLRAMDKREWAMNRAFYNGNQWVFYNKISNQIESLPVSEGDKPRWKVRLTSNQVLPGVQHYVAQLTKTKPVITATPDSSSYRDVSAASVAESLYEYWWQDKAMRLKLQSALVYATMSQGYWKITWDALAGKPMKVMLGPDGRPVLNEELADAYRDEVNKEAQAAGIDPKMALSQFEKTIYMGDIRIDVMPGENVVLDPTAKDVCEAKYAICKHAMDVDDIYARWKVRVEPDATPNDPQVPLAYSRTRDQRPKTVRDVYIGYFRPSPTLPKGRYVVWIESPNQILEDKGWYFPFNDLPLVHFPGLERPDTYMDEPLVSAARPLQKELNRTLSQIVQFKDLTIKPQMIAPAGTLRQRLTDEPGAVFEYNPIQGLKPEWRDAPPLPQTTFATLERVQSDLDKLFNRIPSQRDQLPARSDSGYQLELIQEAVADQMSPVINRLEQALADAGRLMVLLAKEYYIEPRLLKIRGEGGSVQVRKFMNSDLEGGFSFHTETGTGLPRSRAGRQQQILDLVDKQVLSPRMATKYLDLADLKGVRAHLEADEDQAFREHEKLIRGEPINAAAMQQAFQQLNQQAAMGSLDPQQAQMMLEQAGLQPLSYEDHPTHLETHGLFMKSAEFEQLPPDAQQRFMQHYDLTMQTNMDLQRQQALLDPKVAPKVNIAARATTSAPVLGEILRRSGLQVTDEQVAEPPLETAVYDSIDKPDTDDAANDPLTQGEQMLALQMAAADLQSKQAQSAQKMSLANHRAIMDQQSHQQKMDHAEQAHRQRMRQASKPTPQRGG